ncbi:MAG: acylneuraminate cytidylyltransferase family protein [Candidatus Hydrogenedentota bacterium]
MNAPLVVAIVPARGGSRGLPRKNIRELAGKPLLVHTLEAALACAAISQTFLTTDDPEIAAIGRSFGVTVIDRPPELADDGASSVDVALHALEAVGASGVRATHVMLLQPTSPLRTAEHIDECARRCLACGAASAVSVTDWPHPPQKALTVVDGFLQPLFSRADLESPRQKLARALRPNGAIFLASIELFTIRKTFFIDPVLPFFMSEEESIDIDSEEDLRRAERILASRR